MQNHMKIFMYMASANMKVKARTSTKMTFSDIFYEPLHPFSNGISGQVHTDAVKMLLY